MSTSPRMQAFVLLLCERQGIDWSLAVAGDYLRLENADGNAHLLISCLDEQYMTVDYTRWQENCLVIQLEMKFLVTPEGWEPVNVQDCFSRSWTEYWTEASREETPVFDETGMLNWPSMTEYWADRLRTWGWLRKGLVADGKMRMLDNPAQPFPQVTEKHTQKASALHTSHTSTAEMLKQANLFEG